MHKCIKIGIIALFLSVFVVTMFSVWKTAISYQPDFSIFYASAKDVLRGASPYTDSHLFTAFNYPLLTTVFFFPLSFLPFLISQLLFTFVSIVALFVSIFLCFKLLKKNVDLYTFLFVASLTLLAFPVKFTLGMGQVNIIAYTLLLIGFLLYKKSKQKFSIFFLICAVLLKPVLGFTFILFLFEKKWNYFLLLLFILLSAFLLIPIFLHQPNANIIFMRNLLNQSLAGREVYYNQGLLGFISRMTTNLQIRNIFNILGIVVILLTASRKVREIPLVQKLSLLLVTLLLIDPLSWQHHFVFLLLSFLSVYYAIRKRKQYKVIFYAILALSYALVAWNFKMPQNFNAFPLSLLLSNQFYAALLLFGLQMKLL